MSVGFSYRVNFEGEGVYLVKVIEVIGDKVFFFSDGRRDSEVGGFVRVNGDFCFNLYNGPK